LIFQTILTKKNDFFTKKIDFLQKIILLKVFLFSPIDFTIPESDRIQLDEILAEEIIDNELMSTDLNVVVKCRFAILSPAAWLPWIKAHLGVTQNEIHLNKDDSKIFIRMFTLAQGPFFLHFLPKEKILKKKFKKSEKSRKFQKNK